METPKLVTVTRTDIPEGYQAVQSTHAAIDFVFEHPTRAGPWHRDSNTLVMLTVRDVRGLLHLMKKCDYLRLSYTVFREPDIGNQITAICIEPHPETYKMVSKLPLLIPKTQSDESYFINKGTSSQPHQEDSLRVQTEDSNREGEDGTLRPDISTKQGDALGTNVPEMEEEGEERVTQEEISSSSD